MDHDEQCRQQDRELTLLKEQFRTQADDVDAILTRAQLLVDQYHAQNVTLTEIRGRCELLNRDLQATRDELAEVKQLLKESFVQRNDYDPVKRIVYGLVGIVLLNVAGALMWLVVKGGGK